MFIAIIALFCFNISGVKKEVQETEQMSKIA
jgi:hypothetical protein